MARIGRLAAAAMILGAPVRVLEGAAGLPGFDDSVLPKVQRGDTDAGEGIRPTRGVALGFPAAGGTILFDVDQLLPVSVWFGGFVRHSDQPYFGRYWAASGEEMPDPSWFLPHALGLRPAGGGEWMDFEMPLESDPVAGSRFDGYQVGKSSIRLRYRLAFGETIVRVSEDVRMETRDDWQGFSRSFTFEGVPEGARIGLAFPAESDGGFFDAVGRAAPSGGGGLPYAPVAVYRRFDRPHAVAAGGDDGAGWESAASGIRRLVSAPARAGEPVRLRADCWRPRDGFPGGAPPADRLAGFVADPVTPDVSADDFRLDHPLAAAATLPEWAPPESGLAGDARADRPLLAPIHPGGTEETFDPVVTRRLRFVIASTTGGGGAGIDEIEVFGPEGAANLAPRGAVTASSVIPGYPIHQIVHLVDGMPGNDHSWVADEEGAWIQIDWPDPVEISRVVWARDRTGVCRDRLPDDYTIEAERGDGTWEVVARDEFHQPPHSLDALAGEPGYSIEAIPMPYPDCRPSGVAFDGTGTMYLVAMTRGEVWRTRTPRAENPDRVAWTRFAEGLNHPIGIRIVDGRVFVAQKPEITELIDRDGDGAADHYRTVAGGWGLSQGWHEYTFGLAADRDDNLWFALNTGFFWTNPGYVNPGRFRGSIMMIEHGSEALIEVARGCRVPNGICVGPDGGIFFTDNQGDWIQSCKLAHVQAGRFFGHPETREVALPDGRFPDGRSAVWMPYQRSRSTSGPAFDDTGGRFGPFDGQFFVGDVGYGGNPGLMRVALELVDGEWQGACFPFTSGQPLGCERLEFGPDGALYQASLTSGLTVMRFSGPVPMAIRTMRLRSGGAGFIVELTRPLAADVAAAIGPDNFRIRRYHYIYSGEYGSPEADNKDVAVDAIDISGDRREITLALPIESHPIGMVYEMSVEGLRDAEGNPVAHSQAWYTVQRIPGGTAR